jgi:hypothetical protein
MKSIFCGACSSDSPSRKENTSPVARLRCVDSTQSFYVVRICLMTCPERAKMSQRTPSSRYDLSWSKMMSGPGWWAARAAMNCGSERRDRHGRQTTRRRQRSLAGSRSRIYGQHAGPGFPFWSAGLMTTWLRCRCETKAS